MAVAILTARSFDCGQAMVNSADYVMTAGVPTATTALAHTGSYSLNTGWWQSIRWAIPGTPSDPSVSVWVHPADETNTYNKNLSFALRYLLSTPGVYIDLRWNATTHTFDAYVNDILVEAGTVEVSAFGWFHVQFYVVVNAVGSIQVKIDGHESINYSGDTGTDTVAYFYISPSTVVGAVHHLKRRQHQGRIRLPIVACWEVACKQADHFVVTLLDGHSPPIIPRFASSCGSVTKREPLSVRPYGIVYLADSMKMLRGSSLGVP